MADQMTTRQLDFYQAMSDFRHMFPNMDEEVIEAVLRANNGAVDETIDQLLTMNVDCSAEDTVTPSATNPAPPYMNQQDLPPRYPSSTSSDDDDPPPYPAHSYQNYGQGQASKASNTHKGIPPSESAQSLQSPDAVDTANDILLNLAGLPPFDPSPPGPTPGASAGAVNTVNLNTFDSTDAGAVGGDAAVGAVGGATACANEAAGSLQGASAFPFEEEEETDIKKPFSKAEDFSPTHQSLPMPPKMSLLEHDYTGSSATKTKKRYCNWNPPMLGTLPDDFLRITITPSASPVRCPAHPHVIQPPLTNHHSSSPSSPRRHRISSGHLHSRSSVSPSRPSLSRAETLPAKSDIAIGSPKGTPKVKKDSSSSIKSRTFGFKSRRQKSETDAHLTNTLRKNPLAAAHGKEEINSSIIQQKLAEIERISKNSLTSEEAQALEDERLALLMQNQEFLQLLKHDTDFMKTLEKERMNATAFEPRSDSPELDHNRPPPTPPNKLEGYGNDNKSDMGAFPFSQTTASDEHEELKMQLKNMGGSSRKKFSALAKKFFTRKKKKVPTATLR